MKKQGGISSHDHDSDCVCSTCELKREIRALLDSEPLRPDSVYGGPYAHDPNAYCYGGPYEWAPAAELRAKLATSPGTGSLDVGPPPTW